MTARQEAPSRDLNEGSGSRFASSALTTIEGSERAKDVYQGLAMGILSSDVETKRLKKKKKIVFAESGLPRQGCLQASVWKTSNTVRLIKAHCVLKCLSLFFPENPLVWGRVT